MIGKCAFVSNGRGVGHRDKAAVLRHLRKLINGRQAQRRNALHDDLAIAEVDGWKFSNRMAWREARHIRDQLLR